MTVAADLPRSKRLKAITSDTHDQLDTSVMAASSFDSLRGYGRFVQMQWALHRDVDALYGFAPLQELLPELETRRRLPRVEADLADLGMPEPAIPGMPIFEPGRPIDTPTALGWLYVVEGSNMGAALLRKQAAALGLSDAHGARHLAPADAGPAAHWRSFTEALNAVELTQEQDGRVEAGAQAAFARAQELLAICMR